MPLFYLRQEKLISNHLDFTSIHVNTPTTFSYKLGYSDIVKCHIIDFKNTNIMQLNLLKHMNFSMYLLCNIL